MNSELWRRACDFHGHECPGLAIGARACEAAMEALGIDRSVDEELVCVTENDACGVDAVQALLGCTIGKGNLIYRDTGKHAYTFYDRRSGRGVRFYLKSQMGDRTREQYFAYLLDAPTGDLFSSREVDAPPPEEARKFASVTCELCGERAPEHKIRIQGGKQVCLDCFVEYDRGW